MITLGEEGMILFERGGAVTKIPTAAQEVYDVSGAGDTVIAALGSMLAAGVRLEQAVRIANRAGGIKVTKLGTAVVSKKELFG